MNDLIKMIEYSGVTVLQRRFSSVQYRSGDVLVEEYFWVTVKYFINQD